MTLPHGCLEILWRQSITMVKLLSFVRQVLTMMVPYMLWYVIVKHTLSEYILKQRVYV